jgi:DNA-binding transcriptional MerR regulator
MKKHLNLIKDKKYIGVAELAEESARILQGSGPLQEKATVTEIPDERTIRYYLTEGLISPAEEKQGTASVFGYRHLLQLLVIKKLQAEHLPIRKIKEIVSDRRERDLERLLGDDEGSGKQNEAMRFLQGLLTAPSRTVAPPPAPAVRAPMQRSDFVSQMPGALSYQTPAQPVAMASSPPAAWERMEIEPGLELHIRSDYRPPVETRGVRHLSRAILTAIISFGQRPRK